MDAHIHEQNFPFPVGLEAGFRLAPDLGVNSAIANFTEFLDIL